MPQILGPDGEVCDTTDNPVALAYYDREPGYEIVGADAPVVEDDGSAHAEVPQVDGAETVSDPEPDGGRHRRGHSSE